MPRLIVREPGAKVQSSEGELRVTLDGVTIARVPSRKVTAVTLAPGTHMTTPTIRFLLRRGVPITFADGVGLPLGHATSVTDYPVERLRAQLLMGDETRLANAQAIVRARISAMGLVVTKAPNWPEITEKFTVWAERSANVTDHDRLRGLEGLASRTYYELLAVPLEPFGFTGRNRQPPLDPVNAAWGYAAGVLRTRMEVAVRAAGLHPEVGFLHETIRRNPALALDLMEEFRAPLVEMAVMNAFMAGSLSPTDHFTDGQGGILLNDAGRRAFLTTLERLYASVAEVAEERGAPTWEEAIDRQAAKVARSLIEGSPYEPFPWRGPS